MAGPLHRGPTTALAGALLLSAGSAQAATTFTWSSQACNGTLQACVTNAGAGDTVQIATNAPINEAISFQKSLTLQAAPGFHPLLSNSITASPTTGSNSITIKGLTIRGGSITVDQESTGPLSLQITNDTIVMPSSSSAAIEMYGGGNTVTFDVSNNMLTATAYGIGFENVNASGRIADNTIAIGSDPAGAAITVAIGATSSSIDVVRNRISRLNDPGGEAGISFDQYGAGTLEARILDNLVIGPWGAQAGIALDGNAGSLIATVVNNTIADGENGILAEATSGTISGLVANNVVVANAVDGIDIEASLSSTLTNRDNLVFGNGTDFPQVAAGPGTVTSDPRFVGVGNYHLKPSSPGIDAGDDSDVPSDLMADLDGNLRNQGRHVDIGAYEAPGPSPAGAPRSFTGELQIVTGDLPLTLKGSGFAALSTSVAPPSFTLPAGVFVANSEFLSFLSVTKADTRELLTLNAENAQGTLNSLVHRMPLSGLLKFKRIAYPPIVDTATGSIDASHVGAPGKATAGFHYFIQTLVFAHSKLTFTTKEEAGTAMLTGQSFAVTKDSRTAAGGGHIQMVAPFSFASSISNWNPSSSVTLALDFAPEPDRLAVGAVAIAMLLGIGFAKRRVLHEDPSGD